MVTISLHNLPQISYVAQTFSSVAKMFLCIATRNKVVASKKFILPRILCCKNVAILQQYTESLHQRDYMATNSFIIEKDLEQTFLYQNLDIYVSVCIMHRLKNI
jgi:hypothetical protein